jgi:hypothetical protein
MCDSIEVRLPGGAGNAPSAVRVPLWSGWKVQEPLLGSDPGMAR